MEQAMDLFEEHGAVNLDEREAEWRQSGWTGHQPDSTVATSPANPALGVAAMGTAAAPQATTTARDGEDQVIPVAEETLRVGKRATEGGRVRVRSYIVETPVTEQVTLREEHVDVQRRAIDRPLTDAEDVFEERTIEATEHAEEAVVGKAARVTEEVVIRKGASERVETVHDTVRRQEVEIEDSRTGGTAGTTDTGTKGSNPPGTVASRAVDDVLDTNISGANPKR
jgi:uncharacterized protein (TIGR02271 family)